MPRSTAATVSGFKGNYALLWVQSMFLVMQHHCVINIIPFGIEQLQNLLKTLTSFLAMGLRSLAIGFHLLNLHYAHTFQSICSKIWILICTTFGFHWYMYVFVLVYCWLPDSVQYERFFIILFVCYCKQILCYLWIRLDVFEVFCSSN